MKLDFGYYLPKRATGLQIPSLSGRWRRLPAIRLIGVGLVVVVLCAVAAPALIGAAYLAAGRQSLADTGGAERAAGRPMIPRSTVRWLRPTCGLANTGLRSTRSSRPTVYSRYKTLQEDLLALPRRSWPMDQLFT